MVGKRKKKDEPPMKIFYLFYAQERWDNWISTLSEMDFEPDPGSGDMPEGLQALYSFMEDITVSVLKIVRLYQNERFSNEEARAKIDEVESVVMSEPPEGEIGAMVGSMQVDLMVLFAACGKYLDGGYGTDMKSLVKKGKKIGDDDPEAALAIAAEIGANVIGGAACCARYLKGDPDEPGIFDEWLNEIDVMHDAMKTLSKFDEAAGEGA